MAGIANIKGTVKHYDWGGTSFIPSLLQVENPGKQPFAEYWLGIHPLAQCLVEWETGEQQLLIGLIDSDRKKKLGRYVYKQFGNLPYLLKTLDVKDMLSIQVHPSKADAEREFLRENDLGIPLDAPNRNYKDDNHKPELALALSEFWLLHGFKTPDLIRKTLESVDELNALLPLFRDGNYKGLYSEIMEMPQERVNTMLSPLLDRITPLYNENRLFKTDPGFWAARASMTFSNDHAIDRGIFSIYLFNLIKLEKGEAVFQDAGIPHAYLEGQNVEIMSNSDNVLRGGLTNKHIDSVELMKHVRFEPTDFKILRGEKRGRYEKVYKTKAPDFELSSFQLAAGKEASFKSSTFEILLLTEGQLQLVSGETVIEMMAGKPSAIILPGNKVSMKAISACLVARASVPRNTGE